METRSEQLFEAAKKYIPGGVNSPVRAFGSVGRTPRFIASAQGDRIIDVDGNEMIDYICSWGPGILGHTHPRVIQKVQEACEDGLTYGAPTEKEVHLAKLIAELVPGMEVSRLVSSGTAALTTSVPDSAGVPADYTKNTLVAQYNDTTSVEELFAANLGKIAAVIVEPVAANMGVVLPDKGFLEFLREITERCGALLIFDEVITGFRLSLGGAQEYYGITPDLTTLGKIVGGGMPIGAYGGRKEIMEMVSPVGPVYQAGTLSGNPIATTAGIETLTILKEDPGIYKRLEQKAKRIAEEVKEAAGDMVCVNQIGSLLSIFFTDREVTDYESAITSHTGKYAEYFNYLLDAGIYVAPSQFEAVFLSEAHTEEDISYTCQKMREYFSRFRSMEGK